MRHSIKILLTLILYLFLSSYVKSQDIFYYYYDGQRINLYKDKKSIVIVFNQSATFKNREQTFARDTTIVQMDMSDGTEDIYFSRLSYSRKQDDILKKLKTYNINESDLETYSYGYQTEGGGKVWATNEVIIKPKIDINDDSLQTILNEFNASFFEKDKYGTYFYKVENSEYALMLSAILFENDLVKYAEPVFSTEIQLATIPPDPYFPEQYYLNNTGQIIDGIAATEDMDIDALEAWVISNGNLNIRVAIIDDGVDLDPVHEDMINRVISGYTPGCVSNCDGRPRSNNKHGQAVAGIIAANHNFIGVSGIAPIVKIVPFRIYDAYENPKTNKQIGKAINKAWDDFHCDVLSNSWSFINNLVPSDNYITNAIWNAYTYGRNGKGCPVIFSAGNEGPSANSVQYPATLSTTLAVGACNKFGHISSYSSNGPEIDISAFGGGCYNCSTPADIRTTDRMGSNGYNNGNYTSSFDGTSAACPQVSGVAALLLSVDPSLTVEQVYCRLKTTATDLGAFGNDNHFGSGVVNAYRAIALNYMSLVNKNFTGKQDFFSSGAIISTGTNIKSGADVTYEAKNIIRVFSGKSEEGSNFHAYITAQDPCSISTKRVINYDENKLEQKLDNNKDYLINLIVFPNPFNIQTNVCFRLDEATNVTIYVLNEYGNKVMQVYNQYTEQGIYTVKINGNKLSSGLFICVMETATDKKICKIVKL